MVEQHNEGHMKFLLTISVPMIVFSISMIYWYLLQIEINKTLTLPTGLESFGAHESTSKTKKTEGLEEEPAESMPPSAATATSTTATKVSMADEKTTRYRISKLRQIVLLFTALTMSLLAYLVLVMSGASIWLNLLGLACFITIGMWQQISEELRRQRLDRLVAIITLLFFAASFMAFAAYASKSLKEGEIYQGKARIVGFDYESYKTKQEGEAIRTDLEVAWGGDWGCPQAGGKQCQAFVQGAMCESEQQEEDAGHQRRLDDKQQDGENNENEELEEEVQQEEEKVEEVEEENEELEEEVEEYEEYTEELEEDVVAEEGDQYTYHWDDDQFTDGYWDNQDWDSIWGEYACYDLFDTDLSGNTYNADEPPGEDEWPFITIYGNCNRCEAFIVDYFSTEYFQNMQSFKIQGQSYLIVSFVGLILTVILHFKHRMDPIAEKELELLPNDGGALA